MKILFIAGHGPCTDGTFDPGATGYIPMGEHRYYRDLVFPKMKAYSNQNIIYHTAYNVYNRKNIVSLAQSLGVDSVVEWHFDAWKPQASGGHVIVHSSKTPNSIDKALVGVIENHIGLANRTHKGVRGIDGRADFFNPNACQRAGIDYRMVELGFGTNKKDADIMVKNADQIAKDFIRALGQGKSPNSTKGTAIAGQKPTVTLGQMKAWAKKKGADPLFICLAEVFYQVALGRKLDPALLYAQSAKETNYMKFTGVLDMTYCNPSGLKTKEGGACTDPRAHERFRNWEKGIKAQADHLNLYAGAPAYPMVDSPDPRHFPWILGTAKTVETLGGRWAPSPSYGEDIVRLMKEIQAQ